MLKPSSFALYISYTCSKCGAEHVERRLQELMGVKQIQCVLCLHVDQIRPIQDVIVKYGTAHVEPKKQKRFQDKGGVNADYIVDVMRAFTALGWSGRTVKEVAECVSRAVASNRMTYEEFAEAVLRSLS